MNLEGIRIRPVGRPSNTLLLFMHPASTLQLLPVPRAAARLGVFFTVQQELPILRNEGSIILNASVAHYTGNPGYSVYAATRAAVRSFARNWSVDFERSQDSCELH